MRLRQRLAGTALLAALCASAQSATLLEIYDAAVAQEPGLQAMRAYAEAEGERLPQAQAQWYPSVTAQFAETRNDLTAIAPNFLGHETISKAQYPSRSKAVTLRQPIYRPFLTAQLQQADAQVRDAQSQLQTEEFNLAARLTEAYLDVLLAQDQVRLLERQRETLGLQLDAAQKLFQSGQGVRTDADELQAKLDLNAAQSLEARQQIRSARQALQNLVDIPLGELPGLQQQRMPLAPLQPGDAAAWMQKALENSPQIASLKARVEIAQQEVDKAAAGHKPTLDLVLQASDSQSDSVTNTSSRYVNRSYGVQLNLPLYAGGLVQSQVRQATAQVRRAEQMLEAARRDLGSRVLKEYRGVVESGERIRALQQAVASAQQMAISTQKSFQAGIRTRQDVVASQLQLDVARRDLAQACYAQVAAYVRLQALVGAADRSRLSEVSALFAPQP